MPMRAVNTKERLRLPETENTSRETGGLMLSINELHNLDTRLLTI